MIRKAGSPFQPHFWFSLLAEILPCIAVRPGDQRRSSCTPPQAEFIGLCAFRISVTEYLTIAKKRHCRLGSRCSVFRENGPSDCGDSRIPILLRQRLVLVNTGCIGGPARRESWMELELYLSSRCRSLGRGVPSYLIVCVTRKSRQGSEFGCF